MSLCAVEVKMVNEACLLAGRLHEAVAWSKLTGGLEMWASMHAEHSSSTRVQPQDGQIPSSVLYAHAWRRRTVLVAGSHLCSASASTVRRQHDSRLRELSFASTHIMCSGKHAPRRHGSAAEGVAAAFALFAVMPCVGSQPSNARPANRVTSLLSGFNLRKLTSTERTQW